MKNRNRILALLLAVVMLLLSSCSVLGTPSGEPDGSESTATKESTDTKPSTDGNEGGKDTTDAPDNDGTDAPDSKDPIIPDTDADGDENQSDAPDNEEITLPDTDGGNADGENPSPFPTLTLPENAFPSTVLQSVIGSIVQTGDGTAYVSGTVPVPQKKARSAKTVIGSESLVTLEHAFGYSCYVSGYIGNSLYIIQDFGSLGWNKKGIGHKDGTVLLKYGENGYFSISSFSEGKVIVGNPTDDSIDSLWGETDSYLFGYMVYDQTAKELRPLYAENNLRFYTAGYFINGVALVSVKQEDKILFGVIDAEGNYVVEPQYELMADERFNDAVIVALDAETVSDDIANVIFEEPRDTCGRNICYDSTLMTNVQSTRYYECTSQSVGIINAKTGEYILPCTYAYIERVSDNTYFVVDNDGACFLYNADTDEMTAVEEGGYSYFNADWMLYLDGDGNAYLADKELQRYETDSLEIGYTVHLLQNIHKNRINTNVVSAIRDTDSQNAILLKNYDSGIVQDYSMETFTYTITVKATGEVLENVRSFTAIRNGCFLYTAENSLYRYNTETGECTRVETGYGNYTEDYSNQGIRYYTSLSELNTGIYVLRYNIELDSFGSSYFDIIINDKGTVLYDSSINNIERLTKNYLGRYDDALLEIAGSTQIEDNYLLTRDDGSHFLIQFVRGEEDGVGDSDASDAQSDLTRTVDSVNTFSLLSPFMLDFEDGSEITVSIGPEVLPAEHYVYDSKTQSLKLLTSTFDCLHGLLETMRENGYVEITVAAKDETVTLRIEVSPFAYRF